MQNAPLNNASIAGNNQGPPVERRRSTSSPAPERSCLGKGRVDNASSKASNQPSPDDLGKDLCRACLKQDANEVAKYLYLGADPNYPCKFEELSVGNDIVIDFNLYRRWDMITEGNRRKYEAFYCEIEENKDKESFQKWSRVARTPVEFVLRLYMVRDESSELSSFNRTIFLLSTFRIFLYQSTEPMVQLLLMKGAKIPAGVEDRDLFIRALQLERPSFIGPIFLKFGRQFLWENKNNFSPFHYIVIFCQDLRYNINNTFDIVRFLRVIGEVDINHRDIRGNTALHYCRSFEGARLMLENGADPKMLNEAGKRALHGIMPYLYPEQVFSLLINKSVRLLGVTDKPTLVLSNFRRKQL